MKIDNKQKILSTALSMFAEKGYESVGVQEIVDACKITKPTLYYYFKNKRTLFESIFKTIGADFLSGLTESAVFIRDFPYTLQKIIKFTFDFAKKNRDFFILYYSLGASALKTESTVVFSKYKTKIDSVFTELFEKSSEQFANMREFKNLYAQIFKSTVNFSVFEAINKKITLNDDTIFHLVHSFLWGVAS